MTPATLSIAETQTSTAPPSAGSAHRAAALGDPAVGLGAVAAEATAVEPADQAVDLVEPRAGPEAVELKRRGVLRGGSGRRPERTRRAQRSEAERERECGRGAGASCVGTSPVTWQTARAPA